MAKKILLIDDDPLVRKTLENFLKRENYTVVTASTAQEAENQAKAVDFDVVISDVRMPKENGIVAIQKIKKIYEPKEHICGYILITGYAEEDTPEHAIRLGIDKFILKPLDIKVFRDALLDELKLVEQSRDLAKQPISETAFKIAKSFSEKIKLRRAVITGIGAVAPNGIGKEAYWKGLREGQNCVDKITFFDVSTYPSKMAAEIKNFDPHEYILQHNEVKRMGRSSHLAIAASKLALKDSQLTADKFKELNVIVGSGTAGIEYIVPEVRAMERGGIRKMKPYLGIAGFGGAISSEISRAIGANGFSYTLSTGCTSATDAMGYAMRQIRFGMAESIITGGADACVDPGILGAFCQMGAVSTRASDFKKASRPFNKDRDGFVIAEGSWIFLLEEMDRALARNAPIYGEIVGYGATCDAWHMSKPHPSGEYTSKAIQLALADAGLNTTDIDIFEAYGNATPINDSYETAVIKKVFGTHAYKLAVPSVKSMLGHPIGAAGAQQVAAALLALNEGFIHPTINYEIPDPDCDLDYVPNVGREGEFTTAVCNSLAFGSKNAAIIIRKFKR